MKKLEKKFGRNNPLPIFALPKQTGVHEKN
jgi:hypothetical protein